MGKFKKGGGKGLPAISTASLPDIIFILLFFFMVAIQKYAALLGTSPRIQLDDKFAEVEDIQKFISKERESTADKLVPFLTTNLKVHDETKMGIITDIKQELRKANQLKLNYSAAQRAESNSKPKSEPTFRLFFIWYLDLLYYQLSCSMNLFR